MMPTTGVTWKPVTLSTGGSTPIISTDSGNGDLFTGFAQRGGNQRDIGGVHCAAGEGNLTGVFT